MLCCGPVRLSLAIAAAALAALPATDLPAQTPGAAPAFTPCRLEQPLGLGAVPAECTEIEVPEDYAQPAGRRLRLHVARVAALSRNRQPDPVVILAGGPGLGASVFYPGVAPYLARIRRDRDLIIIDQRGTGRSHPLDCQFDEQQMWSANDEETARVMAECLERLSAEVDVAQFTTSVAVRDLESVREALGLARLNFYASSYGTRVAQHYARRYPGNTRALILDGVVPPQTILGPGTPLVAQAALERTFERCTQDEHCRGRFGDPRADYEALRSRLAEGPVMLELPDPRSGEPQQVEFSQEAFAGALRLAGYAADRAALLPLMLSLANREARYGPLAAQFLMTVASYDEVIAYGMHNTVVCTEDVPLFDTAGVDRESLARTFLGTAQVDALRALCEHWPRGPMDEDLHAPLESAAPALLLSGTADPVTPASYGAEAAKGFRHAVHLELTDQGHGQIVQPCIDRVMAEFLNLAADPARVGELDVSCARRIAPPPFFLSLGGPAP